MLLENRKKQLELSLLKQPRHEIGPARSARATPGPSAQQPMARPPNRPGAAPLLGHIWPIRRPPFPAVRRRRSGSSGRALFSRKQKPGDDASPANPRLISPLCFLSPQKRRQPWNQGKKPRRRRRPPRRRACSPVWEHAAVERLGGGALSEPARGEAT